MNRKLLIIPVVIFIAYFILLIAMYENLNYGMNIEVSGKVSRIEWQSSNHLLPKIFISDSDNMEVILSNSTIVLDATVIKVGDIFEKEKGSFYCLVNGEKLLFSKPSKKLKEAYDFLHFW